MWSEAGAAGNFEVRASVALSPAVRMERYRRLADLVSWEDPGAGKATAGESGGEPGPGCPVEVAVRWFRERRRSLGPSLVRRECWVAGAGGKAGAGNEAAEAVSFSLPTSIKAPGWLVMLIVK